MVANRHTQQTPGLYRRTIGDLTVSMIVDGTETFSFDILSKDITENEGGELLAAAGLPRIPIMPVNAYLVQNGQRTILVDAGDGNAMGTGGKLPAVLTAAGIAPSAVDTLLLTHAHPDHVGGLIAPDGSACFPNAELVLHEEEFDFWSNEETVRKMPRLTPTRTLACKTFHAYRSSLRTARAGEVAPGITMQHLPGHTPGHSGYLVASGNDSVFIWGDIVHWPDIQIPRPDVTLAFDIDPAQMVETRKRLFEQMVSDNLLAGGMHLNLPGFLRLAKQQGSYAIARDGARE